MPKKTPRFFSSFSRYLLLLGVIGLLWPSLIFSDEFTNFNGKPCPFCSPQVIAKQSYYEGLYTRVLYNHAPYEEGHSMLIPIRHVQRVEDLTAEELQEIFTFIPQLNEAFGVLYGSVDFVLLVQNGRKAGQTVNHVHFHIIPRKEASIWKKLRVWAHLLGAWSGSYAHLTEEELAQHLAPLRSYFLTK